MSSCRTACVESNNVDDSKESLMLCVDGAHLLIPVCIGDYQEDDAELAGGLEASGSTAPVQNLRWCRRGVLHVLEATISIAAREWLRLCADDAHLLMLVCFGDVQLVGYASEVVWTPVAVRFLCLNMLCRRRVVLRVLKAIMSIATIEPVILCADDARLLMPVYIGDVQDVGFARQQQYQQQQKNRFCEYGAMANWSFIRCGGLFHGVWMDKWLCVDGVHLLMPVYVGDMQLVGCARQATGRTMLSWQVVWKPVAVRFLCSTLCWCRVVLHLLKATVAGAKEPLRLCADGVHMLIPVCVDDVQDVGFARQASLRLGDSGRRMLSWQAVKKLVALLLVCFNLRWCHCVVLHVLKATIRIAEIEPLMRVSGHAELVYYKMWRLVPWHVNREVVGCFAIMECLCELDHQTRVLVG
ncbi:hypothetical protein cyc_01550 [Cyclospora cayetanensis]|uniref:Uncharacterized protein n=1 Tax=Cyclospora cayetanensis TaxID=88456 RepID=A0A1D3CZF1_9EIME|nr:hypothetical protein cyc_01550 [Cyclospora cayetanensis]